MKSLAAQVRRVTFFCAFAVGCATAWGGEFSVDPIRLELGPQIRSGVINVSNEGKANLSFQMQAMEWTQDAKGEDQYSDTQDLVFFPKLMTIEPGKEGVIRIGTKFPVVPREKTYRLFIEELPGSDKPAPSKGAQLTVTIRFGAPIFVKPLKIEDGLEVDQVELSQGKLSLIARNTGNEHQMVQGIQLTGTDSQGRQVYALTLADRYLLAGTSKRYSTAIPKDQCAKIAALAIEFKTDKITQNRKLEVDQAMCL